MERLVLLSQRIQYAGQRWRISRWLHIPQLASRLLRWLSRPTARGYGFQYLPPKRAGDDIHRSLADQFAGIATVWAIWPVGARFYDLSTQVHIVRRLILPNPENDFVKHYFKSLKHDDALNLIKSTTLKAQQAGTEVKWIDSFVFNSLTLADYDAPMGWAHIESVRPSTVNHSRLGYIIFKDRAPEQMEIFVKLFLEVWKDGKDPLRG
jgi:hypothetical protein